MPKVRKRRDSKDSQVRFFKNKYEDNEYTFYKETDLPAKKKVKSKLAENEGAVLSASDEVVDKAVSVQPLVAINASTSKTSLYKPPTFEELQNLKETEMLFQSNLLKLQVYRTLCMVT